MKAHKWTKLKHMPQKWFCNFQGLAEGGDLWCVIVGSGQQSVSSSVKASSAVTSRAVVEFSGQAMAPKIMSPRKRKAAVQKGLITKKKKQKAAAESAAVMQSSGSVMANEAKTAELHAINQHVAELPTATLFLLGSLLRSGKLEGVLMAPPPPTSSPKSMKAHKWT
eukprot:711338-Amphidinium_carterae.1